MEDEKKSKYIFFQEPIELRSQFTDLKKSMAASKPAGLLTEEALIYAESILDEAGRARIQSQFQGMQRAIIAAFLLDLPFNVQKRCSMTKTSPKGGGLCGS